jgi:hypothetical protein
MNEFLIEMLRAHDPENLLRHPPADREWEEIVGEAVTHGLTPLLYKSLKGSDNLRRLPSGLADRLQGQFYRIAAWNLVLSTELRSILRAFEDARVPCVPLRGLALAERFYGDITARPMGDLDLLVRKEDLSETGTILGRLGFAARDRRPGFAQAFSYHLEYSTERHGGFPVDPHWTLAYPPFLGRLDMQRAWKRCVRGPVVGVETWLLGQEDLLLHLCLHIAHRGNSAPLLWFYELDRFVRQEQEAIDWERFLSVAHGARVELVLSHSMGKVRELFRTPIPQGLLNQLTQASGGRLEQKLQRLLLRASHWDSRENFALLIGLPGLRAKLRYLFMLLFPSPAFMRSEFGATSATKLILAYLRLFGRLVWKGLRGVALLVFHGKVKRFAGWQVEGWRVPMAKAPNGPIGT